MFIMEIKYIIKTKRKDTMATEVRDYLKNYFKGDTIDYQRFLGLKNFNLPGKFSDTFADFLYCLYSLYWNNITEVEGIKPIEFIDRIFPKGDTSADKARNSDKYRQMNKLIKQMFIDMGLPYGDHIEKTFQLTIDNIASNEKIAYQILEFFIPEFEKTKRTKERRPIEQPRVETRYEDLNKLTKVKIIEQIKQLEPTAKNLAIKKKAELVGMLERYSRG